MSNVFVKVLQMDIKSSFYFTYVMLFTTGTITLIEALRTKTPYVRHVMNLETCISIVAAFFYGIFVKKIEAWSERDAKFDYEELTRIRYNDWMITTPIMLLVLSIVLANENKKEAHLWLYLVVAMLDIAMLVLGYMGEVHTMNKGVSAVASFACFVAIFALVFMQFMGRGSPKVAWVTFAVFVVVWSMYGALSYTHLTLPTILLV